MDSGSALSASENRWISTNAPYGTTAKPLAPIGQNGYNSIETKANGIMTGSTGDSRIDIGSAM